MNERIKELHDKAFDGIDILEPNWFLKHNKKFAELIVQECAKLSDNCPAEYLEQPYKYPSTWIKEHFGVE